MAAKVWRDFHLVKEQLSRTVRIQNSPAKRQRRTADIPAANIERPRNRGGGRDHSGVSLAGRERGADYDAFVVMPGTGVFQRVRHDRCGRLRRPVFPGAINGIFGNWLYAGTRLRRGVFQRRNIIGAYQFRIIADQESSKILRPQPSEGAGVWHAVNFPQGAIGLIGDLQRVAPVGKNHRAVCKHKRRPERTGKPADPGETLIRVWQIFILVFILMRYIKAAEALRRHVGTDQWKMCTPVLRATLDFKCLSHARYVAPRDGNGKWARLTRTDKKWFDRIGDNRRSISVTINRRQFAVCAGAAALAACASTPLSSENAPPVWRRLVTEPYKGKQDDISFVSPDIGWYGNGAGALYGTRDGGETWRKVWEKPGTFIRALGFVDEQNGFLGNVGTDYYPGVTDQTPLYRTRDGGLTWLAINADGIGIVKGICGIDILPRKTIFQGEMRSVPVIHAAGRVGGPATLLRSVDGGDSWRVIDLRAQAGMILDVKFSDANTGLVCAASSDNLEAANALMLRTTDGGQSWKEVYRSARLFENCWKMHFPTRDVGYATVQNYAEGTSQRVFIKTTDGGASWREMPLVEDAAVRQFGVGFMDARRGWIGTSTTGFYTGDGGKKWTPVEMGRAVNKIRILKTGADVRAFAIGTELHRLDG
jgi:photosystem II stability/assembly factor-like uncharacterized protein